MTPLEELELICNEKEEPFFSNEDLQYILDSANGDLNLAAYRALIKKSENSALSLPGLTTMDSSKHYLRLAQQYRPNNSGILKGG